eukprot:255007-Prorocentrum_lima.AAC.1
MVSISPNIQQPQHHIIDGAMGKLDLRPWFERIELLAEVHATDQPTSAYLGEPPPARANMFSDCCGLQGLQQSSVTHRRDQTGRSWGS